MPVTSNKPMTFRSNGIVKYLEAGLISDAADDLFNTTDTASYANASPTKPLGISTSLSLSTTASANTASWTMWGQTPFASWLYNQYTWPTGGKTTSGLPSGSLLFRFRNADNSITELKSSAADPFTYNSSGAITGGTVVEMYHFDSTYATSLESFLGFSLPISSFENVTGAQIVGQVILNNFSSGSVIDFRTLPNLTTSAATNNSSLYSLVSGEVDIYSGLQKLEGLIFDQGNSAISQTIEPVSDGQGGTELVIDPTNVQQSDPVGYNIAWTKIYAKEGGILLSPYTLQDVLDSENPHAGHSGLTIAAGVDLNNLSGLTPTIFQQYVAESQTNFNLSVLYNSLLKTAGLDVSEINSTIISYLQQNTATVGTAPRNLNSTSVSITPSQANELDNMAEALTVSTLENYWNSSSSWNGHSIVPIKGNLDGSVQTTLADLCYNASPTTSTGDISGAGIIINDIIAAVQQTPGSDQWFLNWGFVIGALNERASNNARWVADAQSIATWLVTTTVAPTDEASSAGLNGAASFAFADSANVKYFLDTSGSGSTGSAVVANSTSRSTSQPISVYTLTASAGSPAFSSIVLPTAEFSGEYYSLNFLTGTTWSAAQLSQPNETLLVPSNVTSIRVTIRNPNQTGASAYSDFGFFISFASSGTFNGTVVGSAAPPTFNDLSGDGLSDQIFENGNTFTEWQSAGSSFTPNVYVNSVGNGWTLAGIGDFNADSKSDLIFQNGGTYTEWQSSGNSFTQNVAVFSVGSGWNLAGTGDFNGDGQSDLIFQNGATFTEWQSTGNGFTPNVYVNTVGAGWKLAGVGDFNGDGKSDLIWQNGGTFTEWQATASGTGNSFAPNVYVNNVGAGWTLAGVGDFNGDGKSDLIWQNGGTFTEWQSNGNGFTPNVVVDTLGAGWSVAAVGDFNGDGLSDILFRNTNGTFSEWQSTGTGFITNVYVNSTVGNAWTLEYSPTGASGTPGAPAGLVNSATSATDGSSAGDISSTLTSDPIIGALSQQSSLAPNPYQPSGSHSSSL